MSEPTVKQDEQPEQPASTGDGKMVTPTASASTDQGGANNDPPAAAVAKRPSREGSDATDAPQHPIAEFLYQLTKMLQDDNDEIIEWSHGRIKVHDPARLESEVLHRYFRHSKFASFQRQLNYFGFRKIAGKGKMAPCSYVNEACTSDIRSLLHIKRKTNGSAARKAAMNRAIAAERLQAATSGPFGSLGANLPPHLQPGMAELMSQALSAGAQNPAWLSQQLQQQGARDQAALAAFAAGQKRQSASDFARYGLNPLGALEQLSQLGNAYAIPGLAQQQAAAAALGIQASNAPAPADAAPSPGGATMNNMPATAAMNAEAASGKSSNLFEGNPNLKSLVNEQPSQQQQQQQQPQQQQQQQQQAGQANRAAANGSNRAPSQNLMNRLPSSGTIFPDSLSAASLSHLLPGGQVSGGAAAVNQNRLNSMVSLSGYLSREPSLVDLLLAAPGGGGQYNPALAAAAAAGMQAPAAPTEQDATKRFSSAPV